MWDLLGDPGGYVEPFAGSAGVLLARPRVSSRRVETLNDSDGWLVNAWRAIRHDPAAVADHAYGPVTEIDYHARLAWLQERRNPELVSWLEGCPEHYDAKAAGWWLYVLSCGIGNPFDPGPWRVVDGHLQNLGDAGKGVNRELPHLGDAGKGVNRGLPHPGHAGQGVNRELPHLGHAGQGVNRRLPHPGDAGQEPLTRYIETLANRLNRTRITCGDWKRPLGPSALRAKTGGDGTIGVFLDPPYENYEHYYSQRGAVSSHVRDWCLTAPADLRIVLCGYDDEHADLEQRGWTRHQGKAGGGAGYSNRSDNDRRERLWASPACRTAPDLFSHITEHQEGRQESDA